MTTRVGLIAGIALTGAIAFAVPASARVNPDDRRIAERGVLTIHDLPSGYRVGSRNPSAPIPRSSVCRDYKAALKKLRAQTGLARSRQFSQGNSANVNSDTSVSPTQVGASTFMTTVSAAATADCFHDAFATELRRRLDKVGTHYDKLDAEVGRESTEAVGADRAAYQAKFTIHSGSTSVDIFTDFEFLRVGRGVIALEFNSQFSPFDQVDRSSITSKAIDRMSNALAGTATVTTHT